VEEWCLDRWLALQGGTDPVGSVNPATVNRAARGGCYRFNGASNRCATRNSRGEATAMDARAGCRVVLNLE
jgi:formylglycine-generating enzyme required for sulfatase activity